MTIKDFFLMLLMALSPLVLTGCGSNEDEYEKGYEAAWDEEDKPSSLSSQQKKDGYEDGANDAAMYDEGYQDGYDKTMPKHRDDPYYMEGYKDGKKNR